MSLQFDNFTILNKYNCTALLWMSAMMRRKKSVSSRREIRCRPVIRSQTGPSSSGTWWRGRSEDPVSYPGRQGLDRPPQIQPRASLEGIIQRHVQRGSVLHTDVLGSTKTNECPNCRRVFVGVYPNWHLEQAS